MPECSHCVNGVSEVNLSMKLCKSYLGGEKPFTKHIVSEDASWEDFKFQVWCVLLSKKRPTFQR